MIEPVRWGLLSTAAINDSVLQGCAGSPLVEFAAVASRTHQRARSWADPRGIPNVHGSYESLLDDQSIEAVYISLPNSMHIGWSIRALEAGKHVLCEKPLSRHHAEVRRAFDTSEQAHKLLAEGFMYRFHSQTATIRRLIHEGAIGGVQHLRGVLSFTMAEPETDVRGSTELDGGALMDLGCYPVSAFRLLLGEPERVAAQAIHSSSGVDIRFFGTLFGANGTTGQFDCAMNLPRRDALEIVGTDGVIFTPDPWHCRGAPIDVRAGGQTRKVDVESEDAYRSEFEAASRAIRGGSPLEFGRADATAQAATIEALQAAADSGSMVALDQIASDAV